MSKICDGRERHCLILGLSPPPADVSAEPALPLPAPSRYLLKREKEEERLFNYACRLPCRGAPVRRRTAGKCSFPLVSRGWLT